MIEIDDVHRRFGEVLALAGVSLTIPEGCIFAILGNNGAGKTTLLRILATALRPDEGTVRLRGYDVVRQKREVRRVTGYIPQGRTWDGELTVRENLEFAAGMRGLAPRAARPAIEAVMGQLCLHHVGDRLAGALSKGMQRRLDIARGLLGEPRVIIADEPMAGLDVEVRHEMWQLLRAARATVVVTTHLINEVPAGCDRAALLAGGRLVAAGPITELTTLLSASSSPGAP